MSLELPLTTVADEIHQLKQTLIKSGRKIYDLSMINPDILPPRVLMDRLSEATINPKNHKYSVARGIKKCREAFSDKYKKKFSVEVDAETEICVTLGSKDGVSNLFQIFPPNGRYALLPSPTYPAHKATAELAGYKCTYFHLGDEDSMINSISESLKKYPIRIILLNFPSNPTGQVVSSSFYRKLSKIIDGTDIIIFNDFVYGEMCFDNKPAFSLLSETSLRDKSVEIYSLSKAYNIPGWRIGAVLGAKNIVEKVSRVKGLVDYGIFLPIQVASSYALTTSEDLVSPTVSIYKRRAKIMIEGLKNLGWEVVESKSAASLWVKPVIKESNTTEWVTSLLLEHGISVLPGEIFGDEWNQWARIALVSDEEVLTSVLETFKNISNKKNKDSVNIDSKFYV